MAVQFSDLSHHQGSVDLAAYARAGHDRVMLKATEGTGFLDGQFTARWRQAGTLGLKRGAYHFLRNALPGDEQWAWFISAVRRAGPLQPGDWLCLDSEDTATPARAAACSREFTAAAVAAGFRDGEVYTGRWYADPNGLTAAVFPPGWRRLWLSDYTPAQVALPAGWTQAQLVALQFTDKATVPGIGTPCDYNRVLHDWHTTAPEDGMSRADIDAINANTDAQFTELNRILAAHFGPASVSNPNAWPNSGFGVRIDKNTRAAVAPLMDDEAKVLAAVQDAEADLAAAIAAVQSGGAPADPAEFAAAVLEKLRSAIVGDGPAAVG